MAFLAWIDRFRLCSKRDEGQTMAEYAIVLGVIVPAILLAFAALSGGVGASIDRVTSLF
ncbi:MAG: hypothetical protein QOF27_1667 [Gaiellaceae bacterium]|jgi:Flp pilus assembly pilin Flp|nr:hypothetical protein [Gaiellaceae bacterium]